MLYFKWLTENSTVGSVICLCRNSMQKPTSLFASKVETTNLYQLFPSFSWTVFPTKWLFRGRWSLDQTFIFHLRGGMGYYADFSFKKKNSNLHALTEPRQCAWLLLVASLSKPALNAANIPVQLLGEAFQSLLIRML